MRQKFKTGFTLIELLVVVAIIGILATIIILNLTGAKNRSRYARVVSDMTNIATAVKAYQVANNNVYPGDGSYKDIVTGSDLKVTGSTGWLKDYLPTWPDTPCGSDYGYEYNNWTIGGGTGSGDYIGIHFRHGTTGGVAVSGNLTWVYYYDIRNFDAVTYASKGLNILNISPKEITCHE